MSACDRCIGIIRNERGETGHAGLMETDSSTQPRPGQPPLRLRHFLCLVCGTRWQQVDDRAGNRQGWSLHA
jgi:hypothetical protein